jgi:hypothetical protein
MEILPVLVEHSTFGLGVSGLEQILSVCGLGTAECNCFRICASLLDASDIDAVAVSADYAQQGEIAADLLRAGKHVFMEKPMAVSVEQATKILQAERAGGARLMVGYMKRYDPGNRLVRQTVREWNQSRSKGKLLRMSRFGLPGGRGSSEFFIAPCLSS